MISIYSNFGLTKSCKALLSELGLRTNQTSQTYTAPKSHTVSEVWANEVVKAMELNDYGNSSIWYEFTRDSRFNIPTTSTKPIENAINYLNNKTPQQPFDRTYLEYIYELRNSNKNPEQRSEPDFIVTWRDVGLRAINRLISKKILLIGLIDKDVFVDGRKLTDIEFTEHDVDHAHALELLINNTFETIWGKDSFSYDFFMKFNYDKLIHNLNEAQRVLLDIAYYLTFHEGAGSSTFGYDISLITKPVTILKVQEAYRNSFKKSFEINFDPTIQVTVSKWEFEKNDPRSIINRFLNKNDMLFTLPPEIQSKIRSNPSHAKQIVADFLSEAFSLFYNFHYDTTIRMLNLR